MPTQELLESLKITIPNKKEDTLPFFKKLWILNSQLTYEECKLIVPKVNDTFPEDQEIAGLSSLFLMNSAYIRNKHKELNLLSNKTLEVLINTQNTEGEGAWYIITGASYRSQGNNDIALSYIEKGIKLINERSSYSRFQIIGYYQGGEIFYLFNKLDESLNYFNKALTNPDIDIWLKARTLNGIGNVYLKQKNYLEAERLLHEAYDLVKEKGNKLINARLLSDLGNYYFEIKSYNQALEYENQSYELRKEANLIDPSITNLLHFYQIYKASGENDKAFKALEEAHQLAREKNLKGKFAEIYQKRVEYFENNKDYEAAFDELKKYVKSREEEMNSSFDLKISGIKAVHELEYAIKEADSTREKNKVLSEANEKINAKNLELKLTLDELTRTKISRKSVIVTMVIGITLCLLTEVFVDPLVDHLSYNIYISLAVKAIIGLLLKPIDSLYENYLIKKVTKL